LGNDEFPFRAMRRREALIALGGFTVAALWQAACGSRAATSTKTTGNAAAGAATATHCVLTPEATQGPYYIADDLTRRDITEHRPGLPLALQIAVVDARTCRAVKGADVEIWHADAGGVYSGFGGNAAPSGPGGSASPTNGKRFLRGHQRSDSHGRVLFDTIYPGWYSGRAPHIHLKVHVGGSVVHTGQIFFSDRFSESVYRTAAYRAHGQPDTTNATDSIYASAGGARARATVKKRAGGRRLHGSITVGVSG
jgi:protocatechuate 3,4-dioxygenase beta subunit